MVTEKVVAAGEVQVAAAAANLREVVCGDLAERLAHVAIVAA